MSNKFSHKLTTWTSSKVGGAGDRLSKSVAPGHGDLVQPTRPFTPPAISTTTAMCAVEEERVEGVEVCPLRNPPAPTAGEGEREHNGKRRNSSSSPEEARSYPAPVSSEPEPVDFEHTVTPKMAIQQYIDKVTLKTAF